MAEGEPPITRWDRVRYWLFTTNSTRAGVIWIATTLLFLYGGGLLALQMRWELASPGETIVDAEAYSGLFTVHGTFMIFLFAVPVFFGFGSIVIPKAIGARNLAFPRLNSLDLWLIITGGLMLEIGYLFGQKPLGGWTGYPPFSLGQYQPGFGMDWWIWAIFLEALGTAMASVNFIATIVRKRRPGLTWTRLPVFVWIMLFTSLLVIVAAPFLLTTLLLLFLDRRIGTLFFDPGSARALLLWQDLFWFYSHPATYVMLLPAFAVVSTIIARFSGKRLFSYALIIVGSAGVTLFSYVVWFHHMFTTGLNDLARFFASGNTFAVSSFSGIIVFTWIATMWRGKLRLTVPMLWALSVIAMFTVGGANGVFMAYIPLDYYMHDTYWLVAHFHYIIFGSTVLGTFAGIYYYFPIALYRKLDETLGKWHFWGTFIGMNLTFFPMHILGLMGLPRRVADYPAEMVGPHVVITVGAFVTALAQIPFIWNVARTLRRGEHVLDETWGPTTMGPGGPSPEHAEGPWLREKLKRK